MANKEPMVAFLEEADKMIRGIVTDGVSLLISFLAQQQFPNYFVRWVTQSVEPG